MFPDAVDRLLKSNLPIKGHEYDICKNGCKMFKVNDRDDSICNYCGEQRFESGDEQVPVATMKIISIGDYLSNMLANEETRTMFMYRATREEEPDVYQDIFDGDVYKGLKQQGFFDGDLDIALALFVDGFTTQRKGKRTMTIIHCLILNVDPSSR